MKGLGIRTSWRLILDEFKDRIVEKCIHFLVVIKYTFIVIRFSRRISLSEDSFSIFSSDISFAWLEARMNGVNSRGTRSGLVSNYSTKQIADSTSELNDIAVPDQDDFG